MPQTIKKTIRLKSAAVLGVLGSSSVSSLFSQVISFAPTNFVVVEFRLEKGLRDLLFTQEVSVSSTKFWFWHNHADVDPAIGEVRFIDLPIDPETDGLTDVPSNLTAAEIDTARQAGVFLTDLSLSGDSRKLVGVDLNGSSWLTHVEEAALSDSNDYSWFALAIQKYSGTGFVSVGGQTILDGEGNEWREAGAEEPAGMPYLDITYSLDVDDVIEQEIYYTTTDPTTPQNTPSNSVGGHRSNNAVYASSYITDYLSSTEDFIVVDSTTGAPTEAGHRYAQVGPEIVKYSDLTSTMLTGVERAISPLAAYPSSIDPNAEHVRYLDIDQLFDKNPAVGTVQYRCVAVLNRGRATYLPKVSLRQSGNADVRIDIGIEIPRFDSVRGFHSGSNDSAVITDAYFANTNAADGYYQGGAVIINNDTSRVGIIDWFAVDDGVATISLLSPVPIDNGEEYRIMSAPSQIASNDITPPSTTAFFSGFFNDGGENEVSLTDHQNTFQTNDHFYIWIKRTLLANADSSEATGAIIIIEQI